MRRYAAKRDAAEKAIVEALIKAGWWVHRMNQPCDLLLIKPRPGQPPDVRLLEVKTPCTKKGQARKRKDQPNQARWLELTGVPVVRTPHAALKAIGCEISSPPPLQLTPTPATLRHEHPPSRRLRRASLLTLSDLRRLVEDRSSPTGPFSRIVPDDEL